MEFCSPEKMGIKSENILNFIKALDDARLATHDVLIMKGGKLLAIGTAEELIKKAGINDFEAAFVSIVKEGAV